jgi:hypothetical protein
MGKKGLGFSECLVNFQDRHGWWETHVEASPFEDLIWIWDEDIHGPLGEYLDRWWDWQNHHVVGAGPPTSEEAAKEREDYQLPGVGEEIDGTSLQMEPPAEQATPQTQCKGRKQNGEQCSRLVTDSEYCYQHADQADDGDEQIAGQGVAN